jgi:DNA-binding winged helix-turn-helix (wHTH) protein/tetratricopeptide (TPR) repeat protein/TolB-like protein
VLYLNRQVYPLTRKAVSLLTLLVENAGEIVSRQQIVDTVWPDVVVEDTSIAKNISVLRKAIRDECGEDPIRTIPKVGYQFVMPVSITAARHVDSPVAGESAPSEAPQLEMPSVALPAALPVAKPSSKPANRLRRWLAGVAILAVIALGIPVVSYWLSRKSSMIATKTAKVVAVTNLRNLSADRTQDWIGTGVAETLRSELAMGTNVEAISGDSMARAGLGMATLQADEKDRNLKSLRDELGCDLLLTGTFFPVGERVRLDLQLRDTASGRTVAQFSQTGSKTNLFELVAEAGGSLRRSLGVAPAVPQGGPEATRPHLSEAALRAYSDGIDKLRTGEVLAASERLQEATRLAPAFSAAHTELSNAWSLLGYDGKAREEARSALDNGVGDSREQRLQAEARVYETTGKWLQAVETWIALTKFFPSNFEFVERLAGAQVASGRPPAAIETLRASRAVANTGQRRIQLAFAESGAYKAMSNWAADELAARETVRLARIAGAKFYEVRGLVEQAVALDRLGKRADARDALSQAEADAVELLDANGIELCRLNQAQLLAATGDQQAEPALRELLRANERNGNQRLAVAAWQSLGQVRRAAGDHEGARQMFEKSLAVAREIGDVPDEVMNRINLGNFWLNTGNPAAALAAYQEALATAREASFNRGIAIATGNIGTFEMTRDLGAARSRLEEALRIKREMGDAASLAVTLDKLAQTMLLAGDPVRARALAMEQKSVLEKAGLWGPRDQIIFAWLAIETGSPADAEKPMAGLGAQSPLASPGAEAYRALAASWLARGDARKARTAIDEALRRAAKTPNLADYGIPCGIVSARVELLEGRGSGLAQLEHWAAEAKKLGNSRLELEARLYLGLGKVRYGDPTGGRAVLAGVRDEAGARGFGLFSARAADGLK